MKYILKVIIGAIFIAIFSQLSFNTNISNVEIPITGQTFAVLLVAYLLPAKESVAVVTLYIIAGAIGFPVFAEGNSGLSTLLGNSGGFIVGFIVGSFATSYWASTQPNTWSNAFIGMFFGTIIIIVFGVLRLSANFGFEKALVYGFYPFWIGALIKIIIGGVMGKLLKDKWIWN